MDEIIKILMKRDKIHEYEAREVVKNCQDEINDLIMCGGTLEDMEDAVKYWLGLEPDYLDAFLEW